MRADQTSLAESETIVSVATLEQPGAGIPTNGPLTNEHHTELALANERSKKIRKAAGVAAFNGWMTGFFAVTSAPFAPFSIVGFMITVGLGVVSYNEFQGRKRLLQFDEEAPRLLGWNQVGFLTMILFYCAWMTFSGLTGESPLQAELNAKPELQQALGSMEEFNWIYHLIIVGVYGTVAVLTAIFQGWNAYYYFSRRKHVEQYVNETPDWVLDVQRATATN